MKAVFVREFGGPDVLTVDDTSVPSPGSGEVLVRIQAAGVNPVDTYIRAGAHVSTPPLPFIPGKDGAGTVEEVGEGVEKVSKGSRVYLAGSVTGTYAEFAVCKEEQVHELPENVSFDKGAGVFVPYATAYRALFQKAKAATGEKLLVHGASGAVGTAAVQWAIHEGLEIYGTAGSEKGRKLLRSQGVGNVFDHSSTPEFAYLDEIMSASGGIDVIIEMLASKNLTADFRTLARFGRIVIVGSRGSLEFDPRLTMTADATIKGMSLFNADAEEMRAIHEAIGKGLAGGWLDPVVGRAFPLEDAAEAHREIIEERAYGKIVLHPWQL